MTLKYSNRMNASGFFGGNNDSSITLYSKVGLEANQSFLGLVLDYNKDTKEALIEVRNHFTSDDIIEVMSPNKELFSIKIDGIYKDGERVDAARHALERVTIKCDKELFKNDILRRL